jgi:hypothetical protein
MGLHPSMRLPTGTASISTAEAHASAIKTRKFQLTMQVRALVRVKKGMSEQCSSKTVIIRWW